MNLGDIDYNTTMRFRYVEKSKLKLVPPHPGVYTFSQGTEVLYIGKAINLRNRVKNHFQQPSYRDHLFMNQVERIGYLETPSEIDALLLESKLIKEQKPKYNVMWKDDKSYSSIAITKEPLPLVFITRKKNLKAEYIGPFVESKAIKTVLQMLRRAFPYYTKKHGPKLCSWCHLNLCPGPHPDVKAYKQNLKNLAAVLKGKRLSVLKNIKKDMQRSSELEHFELAVKLRDQFLALGKIVAHSDSAENALERIFRTKKEIRRVEAYDISNMQGKEATGSMVTFLNGKPAKNWYRKFKIHISGKPNDFAMLEETISRRMKHLEWPYPDLMIIDGGKGQLSSALKALGARDINIAAIAKRHNELFLPGKSKPILLKNLPQSVQNLVLYIRDEAHRFAITYHKKLRKVDFFNAR